MPADLNSWCFRTAPTRGRRADVVRRTQLALPELALIGGTHAMLGAGIGLRLAGRPPEARSKATGQTLVPVGAPTTLPLAVRVLGSRSALDEGV